MTLAWAAELPATEKLVLLALADNSNDEGHCYPSVSTLMRKCGLSERAIQGMISKLSQSGHIECHFRQGRSTVYTVHPRTTCTPAADAPPHDMRGTPAPRAPPPPHHVHPTPAPRAPITVIEPSIEPSLNQGERAARAATARRLPADFELTGERQAIAEAEGVDPAREFAKFIDHWKAASGANARKHDWDAAWRNWCRRAPEMRSNGVPRSAPPPQRTWRPGPEDCEP